MNRRQWIFLGAALLVSAAMAYFLQDTIRAFLFVPVSYIWYGVTLMYQSVAQIVFWFALVVVVTLMAFGSLYGRFRPRGREAEETLPKQGPIGTVARQISRNDEGVYYKWLIANRLGNLARSILQQRSGLELTPGTGFRGQDWDPPADVEAYLESGLTRTFADFPRQRRFARPPETPFDTDLDQVVAYLESQMENHRE